MPKEISLFKIMLAIFTLAVALAAFALPVVFSSQPVSTHSAQSLSAIRK